MVILYQLLFLLVEHPCQNIKNQPLHDIYTCRVGISLLLKLTVLQNELTLFVLNDPIFP